MKKPTTLKAEHPCEGLSQRHIDLFERIAVNLPTTEEPRVYAVLLARGLIDRSPSGYFVPLGWHMRWCNWCDENVEIPE